MSYRPLRDFAHQWREYGFRDAWGILCEEWPYIWRDTCENAPPQFRCGIRGHHGPTMFYNLHGDEPDDSCRECGLEWNESPWFKIGWALYYIFTLSFIHDAWYEIWSSWDVYQMRKRLKVGRRKDNP